MSIAGGDVHTLLAVFPRMWKWQSRWHKQLKKSGAGSSLVLLKFIPTAHLFTLLGLLVISGIVLSLRLTDSRP